MATNPTAPTESGFALAQQKVLRTIMRANAASQLQAYLNTAKLGSYRDFGLMYQAFVRATPVQSPQAFAEMLQKVWAGTTPPVMTGGGGNPLLQALNVPNLLSKGKPLAAVLYRNQPLPVDSGAVQDFFTTEKVLKQSLQGQGLALKGNFYYLHEVEPQSLVGNQLPLRGWQPLVDTERNWFNKRWTLPRSSTMPNAGTSRYQWFSAHWDQLKNSGSQVDVLVTHPKTLLDFALYVGQQEGRFMPLAAWCPNVKAVVFNAADVALQRVELGYLFAGLPKLTWRQWVHQPGGLNAWQDTADSRQRQILSGSANVFYEFVPTEDVYPDGRFARNYRRLHGGQLMAGREYLVLITNSAGWVAVSSGQVIKVVGPLETAPGKSSDSLIVVAKGPLVRLNGLGEGFREDGVLEALANINMALNGHGVFLRDALLGHQVAQRQPTWVLEISRPLAEVPQDLLGSIAKRLHSELQLRYPAYRTHTLQADILPPIVHFVPIGSFAAATPQVPDLSLFDHSTEAVTVKKVVAASWQSAQFTAA